MGHHSDVNERVLYEIRRSGKSGTTVPDVARAVQTGKKRAGIECAALVAAGLVREVGWRYIALAPPKKGEG